MINDILFVTLGIKFYTPVICFFFFCREITCREFFVFAVIGNAFTAFTMSWASWVTAWTCFGVRTFRTICHCSTKK